MQLFNTKKGEGSLRSSLNCCEMKTALRDQRNYRQCIWHADCLISGTSSKLATVLQVPAELSFLNLSSRPFSNCTFAIVFYVSSFLRKDDLYRNIFVKLIGLKTRCNVYFSQRLISFVVYDV